MILHRKKKKFKNTLIDHEPSQLSVISAVSVTEYSLHVYVPVLLAII